MPSLVQLISCYCWHVWTTVLLFTPLFVLCCWHGIESVGRNFHDHRSNLQKFSVDLYAIDSRKWNSGNFFRWFLLECMSMLLYVSWVVRFRLSCSGVSYFWSCDWFSCICVGCYRTHGFVIFFLRIPQVLWYRRLLLTLWLEMMDVPISCWWINIRVSVILLLPRELSSQWSQLMD